MPGTTVGTTLNLGLAGGFSRMPDSIIATKQTNYATDGASLPNFGDPVIINPDNSASKFIGGAGITAAYFAGVAVAEIKQSLIYNTALGGYAYQDPMDILLRGDCTVFCNYGTPLAAGSVYIRTALNGAIPNGVVGGFEAASDGSNSIKLTNAVWKTGIVDANSIAELAILSRNSN